MSEDRQQLLVTRWIGWGLVAWACWLAIGDFRSSHDPRRAALILVCVGFYLTVWLGLMRWRKARARRQ